MKKRKIQPLAILLSIGLSFVFNTAEGAQMFPKMYDASYIYKTPEGETKMRLVSNGTGKVREESTDGYRKSVTIKDYVENMEYKISESVGIIIKRPLKKGFEETTDELMVSKGATNLGLKLISGLECQGWRFEKKGSETEMWLDKEASFIVLSKSKEHNMTFEMVLTNSSKDAPPAELFTIPAGVPIKTINQ